MRQCGQGCLFAVVVESLAECSCQSIHEEMRARGGPSPAWYAKEEAPALSPNGANADVADRKEDVGITVKRKSEQSLSFARKRTLG